MENLRESELNLKPIKTTTITVPSEEDRTQPLSPWSKTFHDPDSNLHIVAIFGSRTPLDESKGKELIRQFIGKHPRLYSIVVGDKRKDLKWARIPKVQFDDVFKVPAIDPAITPGSKMADKFVEDYVYNLSKERFDKSKPLWDLHFLKLKTSKEEGIIIFRAHHSLGDGTSLMSMLLACSRNVSDPTTLPMFPVSKKKEIVRLKGFGCLIRACWRVLVLLWWYLVLLWNTSVDGLKLLATICFLKDTNTPLKGSSGAAFRPRRFVYRTICLDDIKLIKNMMDLTINDVALGITQAGLSYYLNRKYSNGHGNKVDSTGATGKKMKNKLPKNIRLRAMVTVNLRPKGIKEFSENMENNSKSKSGNVLGLFLLPFDIGFRDDPLDYVRKAKVIVDRRKHSLEASLTFWGLKIIPKLFGSKVASAIIKRVSENTTLLFSNVIGPSEDILFGGHHVNVIATAPYGQTQALWITFTSCGNQMTLVASVDEETIDDPHQLCDDIIESLRLVKDTVCACHTEQV